jgi:hypothetical protein
MLLQPHPGYGIKSAWGYAIESMEAVRNQIRLGRSSSTERERLITRAEDQLVQAAEAMGKMMK